VPAAHGRSDRPWAAAPDEDASVPAHAQRLRAVP
jgi:hypothetical protein